MKTIDCGQLTIEYRVIVTLNPSRYQKMNTDKSWSMRTTFRSGVQKVSQMDESKNRRATDSSTQGSHDAVTIEYPIHISSTCSERPHFFHPSAEEINKNKNL